MINTLINTKVNTIIKTVQLGTLLNLASLKSLMAFWSDGTVENGLLVDKSGNNRNATIGDNLITDPSGEYGSVMTSWNGTTGLFNSNEQAHSGTKSYKYSEENVSSLKGARFPHSFRTVTGKTYTYSFWIYRTVGTGNITFNIQRGDNSGAAKTILANPVNNEWVNFTGTYVETNGGGAAIIQMYITTGSLTCYFDDFSVSENDTTGLVMTFANDAVLKAIDAPRYMFYTSAGVPIAIRTDVNNPAINNYKVFDGGVKKIVMLKDDPSISTLKTLYKSFVNSDNLFDTIENVRSIKLDGTGDYTSISAAVNALSNAATATNRFRLDIHDDLLADTLAEFTNTVPERTFMVMIDYFYLNGIGENRKIEGILPASSSDADIDLPTLIYAGMSLSIRNLTFNHRNSRRYLMHLDNAFTAKNKNVFYKCKFNHLGCQDVIDYRQSNALPAPNLGTDITTFGQGIFDGQSVEFVNCEISGLRPFYAHSSNNTAFSQMVFVNSNIQSLPLYHATYNPNSEIKPNIQVWSVTDHSPIYIRFINTVRNSTVEDIGATYHKILTEST